MSDIMVYSTFNSVSHKPLRVYNRVVMFYNLMQDRGKEIAVKYIEQFSENDRKDMYLVQVAIKKLGKDAVYKSVTKDLVTTYDPAVDD